MKETGAALELERSRKGNKTYFDQNKNILSQPLKVGDLVEVEGASNPGGYAPVVTASNITVLGTAALPEPPSRKSPREARTGS